jgi:hypothetical protein
LGIAAIGVAGLVTIIALTSGSSPSEGGVDPGAPTVPSTGAPGASTITFAPTTSAPTTPVAAPPREARYVVPEGEVEREAKQLAADIAYALTTYEAADDPTARFSSIGGVAGVALLAEAGEPLTYPGRWSRGQVLYPQLGGLTNERTSVMVVTRQMVGSGFAPEFSLVRTLDIRLVLGEAGWEFDELASAGRAFDSVEELQLAHEVAADPRIEMPDSARLDILGGGVSPVLLELMSDLAGVTSYGVTVIATGHPYHVFETNQVSHHTGGRAIDINRVGDRHVIDDRDGESTTRALVQWLWEKSEVVQVGSPWDIDGVSGRSFTNIVHQDHIHVAVIGRNDPTWVPAIGDRVWEDLDADGVHDPGEPGIGGVTVRLFDDSGTELGSTVTDDDGAYGFSNLTPGPYHVEVGIPGGFVASPRHRGSDGTEDSDVNAGGVMAVTTLDSGEHDTGWDAGLYRAASIGDLVWEDLDGDGIQDPGEEGIGGVTVRLFNGAGTEVGSTVTDDDGAYLFSNLAHGKYHIEIDIPEGFVTTLQDQGSDDTEDSDVDADGVMEPTTLGPGEDDPTWDAGLHPGDP